MAAAKRTRKPPARGRRSSAPARKPAAPRRYGPRSDKGEGDAAVEARIAALKEPSRSILSRLHPLVRKHAPDLAPTVRYGFAVYQRDGKMTVIVAPYKAYARIGFASHVKSRAGPRSIEYRSADEVDEGKVKELLGRLK